ncbi:orotidine-5'-phosphate decarboxylase [bacterium]|nr:orotidine-5'-phosphate decarboxylase [bacterium]
MMSFAQRAVSASRSRRTLLLLGMDPDFGRLRDDFSGQRIKLDNEPARILESLPFPRMHEAMPLPDDFKQAYLLLLNFAAQTIFALRNEVLGVKFQIAYFEEVGPFGLHILSTLIGLCRELDLIVIMDAKRGDIGSTFTRYLNTYLTDTGNPLSMEADAMTVNPLVGTDTWELFLPYLKQGKGIFLLTYPTAPGAEQIMESQVAGEPLWRFLARAANDIVMANGLEAEPANLGLVAGALRPVMGERIREVFPGALFLVPGVGAQGGTMANASAFTGGRNWALFPASRALLYAYANSDIAQEKRGEEFWKASLTQAQAYNQELRKTLRFE